jgi:hypothetical protein
MKKMLQPYRYAVGLGYLKLNRDLLFYSVGCVLWCDGTLYSFLDLSKRVPWWSEEMCDEISFSLDEIILHWLLLME